MEMEVCFLFLLKMCHCFFEWDQEPREGMGGFDV